VDLDVSGSRIKAQAGERTDRLSQGLPRRSAQHQVDVGDADGVRPDVNLFHGILAPGMADKRDLRSRRRSS